MDKVTNVGIGLTGFAGAEAVEIVTAVSELPVSDTMKAITQVIIAIATVISLFTKKRK